MYRHPGSDHYIVFGEAKIEDLSHQAQLQSLERLKNPDFLGGDDKKSLEAHLGLGGGDHTGHQHGKEASGSSMTKIEESDTEEGPEMDESGIDANDIQLVMTQAGVKRTKAVKALKRNDGDIVNGMFENPFVLLDVVILFRLFLFPAIMELTM